MSPVFDPQLLPWCEHDDFPLAFFIHFFYFSLLYFHLKESCALETWCCLLIAFVKNIA